MCTEYEVEIKIWQEQWLQLKMKFLLGYNLEIFVKWWEELAFGGENKNLVGESTGEKWANFWLVEELPNNPPPYPPSKENAEIGEWNLKKS